MRRSMMESPRTNINDLISAKQEELERILDKLAQYDDPDWIRERKEKLQEKQELLEQELSILQGAESLIRKRAS
ncbi:MAG: hypothetical protein ACYCW6_29620 [Candidatus Xenobia bacterium]